ncbi:MAG: galactokinase family protein [Vulcanisaeta sp.]|nr:GHMP kinase [Vulcanisaeta sp.]MCG2892762.1 GHMP kinase [Vulcanisaeta sp.]MCG2895700.1 GHMP kinase [Vulcanisaeta sp.]
MINDVINEYRSFYGNPPTVVTSAPGRLDFLNTHQDYKGLPVIAVGINLRTYIAASTSSDYFVIASGNLRDEGLEYVDKFQLSDLGLRGGKWFGDYVRALIIVFRRHGLSIKPFRAWIRSSVPIASGLGSSGTLLVAVAAAINALHNLGLGRKDLAELAYEAEHDVMGIPCGRLDQYAAAFGNIVYIETRPPYNVEVLPRLGGVFLVLDTGIRHSTADIHPRLQAEIDEGLNQLLRMDLPSGLRSRLGSHYWEVRWDELSEDELRPYLEGVTETSRNRILYTLRAHESTKLALKVLRGEAVDVELIGRILGMGRAEVEGVLSSYDWRERLIGKVMTYQHSLLSKYYGVSLPVIDELVDFLINEGAYGAKLSGAGLGGSVIALVRDADLAEKVMGRAIRRGLAVRGWVVNVDEGVLVHGG